MSLPCHSSALETNKMSFYLNDYTHCNICGLTITRNCTVVFPLNPRITSKDIQLYGMLSHGILCASVRRMHMKPRRISSSIQAELPAALQSAMIFLWPGTFVHWEMDLLKNCSLNADHQRASKHTRFGQKPSSLALNQRPQNEHFCSS